MIGHTCRPVVTPTSMTEPRHCLLLFTKPARPGRVKTRLTRGEGALTVEGAARMHSAFLGDLAERLVPATLPGANGTVEMRLRVAWALEDREEDGRVAGRTGGGGSGGGVDGEGGSDPRTLPSPAMVSEREVAEWLGGRGEPARRLPDLEREVGGEKDAADLWRLEIPPAARVDGVRQVGPTLGDRLYHALAEAAAEHPGGVAAVGSDHPTLPLDRVRTAFQALAEADVVLGPADDGGYYLIALRPSAVRPELFQDVPWSTSAVLATTEARCHRLDLTLHRLPPGRDVDDPADLRSLATYLAAPSTPAPYPGESPHCPRTHHLLQTWNLLPPSP